VRGGSPFTSPTVQGFATGLLTAPNGTDQGSADDQKAELLKRQDWIKIGLAGNLATYTLITADGKTVTGKEVLYNNAPAGYTLDPQEHIVYVSKHDNETLFDKVQMAMPTAAPLADRIRATRLAMSMSLLAQGVPFVQAGDDLLRSKSGDRDSYDSGDWFNALDWTYNDNGWGRGLPIADKNRDRWDLLRPLLADPALKPSREDILATVAYFQDMVRIRKSSALFRLQTAGQISEHVSFLPTDIPGVIIYVLDDPQGKIGGEFSRIVVIFNATAEAQTVTDAKLGELALALHPVQGEGSDPVVKTMVVDGNSITVPGRTAAVFVAQR
jgi:pullulanase/glycogen debranching enzyme